MIVAIKLLLTLFNHLLIGLKQSLVRGSLHQLHILIFDQVLFFNLFEENSPQDEGDRNGGNKSDDGTPNDHGSSQDVVAIDAG